MKFLPQPFIYLSLTKVLILGETSPNTCSLLEGVHVEGRGGDINIVLVACVLGLQDTLSLGKIALF